MRVALLSHSAPAGDAIGRQLAEKVAFFADRGADVRLFVTSDRKLHPALGPNTHRFAPAEPHGPHWAFLTSADLILVEYSQHDPLFDLLPPLSRLCGRGVGGERAGGRARIIFDYHGVTPPNLGGANHRDFLERGCRLRGLVWTADAAIAHSRFAADELLTDTGFPPELTRTIGHPIDTTWFSTGPVEHPLRSRLRLPSDARLLLFVGRLAPNKRVPVLIEALARLRDLTPAVHAVIAGEGGDAYAPERDRCRERAARLGVSDRVHFLGHVDETELRDAYRDADALVIPSVHEGFCIPVIEALACGTPVIAARAAALPETVGEAGLTFTADDPEHLARQVRRLLESRLRLSDPAKHQAAKMRVAVVAPRFGNGFVGGAESSLRTLALSMASAGHAVEVFTTGTTEDDTVVDSLPVHRFRPDPIDADRHAAAVHVLRLSGSNEPDAAADFLEHSVRSARLVAAIQERGPFDAVVVGPYLLGLTRDVAAAFRDRVLLLPCLHDEPFARLPALRTAFDEVGGVLYHSHEERAFAQASLGFDHPNAHVIGTLLDADTPGDPRQGRQRVGTGRRYILYVGRYCREKGLPELLGFARRYAADHPGRFTFAFAGEGAEPIPLEPWTRDLGFVNETSRRDLMAGADALVLLSPNESLSLVTLEAQAQGVPVIVRAGNAVLEGHVVRGQGGVSVDGYEAFAAALDDLWNNPAHWRTLGRAGQEYVRRTFSDPAGFAAAWQAAFDGFDRPLTEQLLLNGRRRAKSFERSAWREQFGIIVDAILDAPARPRLGALEILPRSAVVTASMQQGEIVVPVRLTNRGQHVEAAEGPGRTEIVARVLDAAGNPVGADAVTPLPGLLIPGRPVAAVVRVSVPTEPGEYKVAIQCQRLHSDRAVPDISTETRPAPTVRLIVNSAVAAVSPPIVPANLEPALRAALAAQELPSGYTDVSEGRLAQVKRWVKLALLHNFKTAYVDVLSRQQSAFNRQVLTALAELGDGQSTLAHAVTIQSPRSAPTDGDDLRAELRRLRRQTRRLRRRLARIEAAVPPQEAAL
jgi:glycosyltransferase involved in cell wall biosynthesis